MSSIAGSETIMNSLQTIVDYNWKDEWRDFQETFNVEVPQEVDLKQWIARCDNNNLWNTHIFYHLMVLKYHYELD